MDAIAQAIESYWAIKSTKTSRHYSREALHKLLPNIESAVLSPDYHARSAMIEGANLAGQAINATKTTAPHAMSYGLTSYYGIPHGQAVSLTLPSFLLFNAATMDDNCQDPRGVLFVNRRMSELFVLLGADDALSAKSKLDHLIAKIMPRKNLGVFNIDFLLNTIDAQRLRNNPRKVSSDDARTIFNDVLIK
jgi:alcohol dehydrogenase class IV